MNVTKNLALPMDIDMMKPHTSECMIIKGLVARLFLSFENMALCCRPLMHASQSNKDVGQIFFAKVNIFWRV